MEPKAKARIATVALAGQLRFGVRRALMGGVAPLLTVEIDIRVARVPVVRFCGPFFGRRLLRLALASISVPSTVKRAALVQPCSLAIAATRAKSS